MTYTFKTKYFVFTATDQFLRIELKKKVNIQSLIEKHNINYSEFSDFVYQMCENEGFNSPFENGTFDTYDVFEDMFVFQDADERYFYSVESTDLTVEQCIDTLAQGKAVEIPCAMVDWIVPSSEDDNEAFGLDLDF